MKPFLHIMTDVQIGELTILRVATNDELPPDVPLSYRSAGTVWACKCSCGETCYYPEKFLKRSQIKSCGHIRQEGLAKGSIKNEKYAQAADLRERIKAVQREHRKLKAKGIIQSYPEIGEKLVFLFAQLKALGYTK
jgi:hypothetical protein